MTVRLAAGAVAAACSVVLLASCSSGSQSSDSGQGASTPSASASSKAAGSAPAAGASSSPTAKAAAMKITIKDFKYQVPSEVKPGQKITVTNSDNVNHTVTSDKDGLFDAVVDSNGGTKTFTAPSMPGKYPFHCTYHANMHGTLVVS
nr:cupredoxin domain-containing protein [Flexivirga endophytica]